MADLSVYHGGPSDALVAAIHAHTGVDLDGNRFFRTTPAGEWRPLRDSVDFFMLNMVIDTYR